MSNHGYSRGAVANFLDSLSYQSILLTWLGLVVICTFIYELIATLPGSGPVPSGASIPIQGWWDTLYYSIITATATGYGDIVPIGFARPIAAAESAIGLLLFGIFASKLLSSRQDVALSEVHQISFQSAFRNAREDLYLARKDLDFCIVALEEKHALNEDEWERFAIALQQIAHLFPEIPHFYDVGSDLYIIDERRETLLIEAVERTLGRLRRLLQMLGENKLSLSGQEAHDELRELFKIVQHILPIWIQHSPHSGKEKFSTLRDLIPELKTLAKN